LLGDSQPAVRAALQELARDKVEHVAQSAQVALQRAAEAQKQQGEAERPRSWLHRLLKRG